MSKRIPLVLAAAALAGSFAAAPASADHTICDQEHDGTEYWIGRVDGPGVGVEVNKPTTYYVCVYTGLTGTGYQLVVIRTGGPQSICTFYGGGGPNSCIYI